MRNSLISRKSLRSQFDISFVFDDMVVGRQIRLSVVGFADLGSKFRISLLVESRHFGFGQFNKQLLSTVLLIL